MSSLSDIKIMTMMQLYQIMQQHENGTFNEKFFEKYKIPKNIQKI